MKGGNNGGGTAAARMLDVTSTHQLTQCPSLLYSYHSNEEQPGRSCMQALEAV